MNLSDIEDIFAEALVEYEERKLNEELGEEFFDQIHTDDSWGSEDE